MTQHDDNSDTWISIGLQAALIVNKLRLQAQLTESSELPVQSRRRYPINSGGVFNLAKLPEMFVFSSNEDLGAPTRESLPPRGENSLVPVSGTNSLVGDVLRVSGDPQIGDSVIASDAVDVVDLVGHDPMNVEPNKAVGVERPSVHKNTAVAQGAESPSDSASVLPGAPTKIPSIGVVAEQFAQSLCRNVFPSDQLRLHEEKDKSSESQPKPRDRDEQKRAEQLRYFERRIAELRAFERRAAGDRSRRERN